MKPSVELTPDEIDIACEQGKQAVKALFERQAVLIRALEPLQGIEQMRQRRGRNALRDLCSGPGKLSQAFGITGNEHGIDLCAGTIGFRPRRTQPEVEDSPRIGISRAAHLPWRFLLKESPFVSVRADGKKKV